MPAQKRSNDSRYEEEDDDDDVVVELQRNNNNQKSSEESEQNDVERESDDDDDDGSASSSSCSEKEEYVFVKLADVRKEVQCPICLGIIRKTRKVMECLHRFCRECIDKSMRMGNNECPACRAHCASRRSLRDDPNYDAMIAILYPDIDKYEEEELAFHEEEKARNKQIQASIAQTSRRQLEALGKKRATAKATATAFMRRSQGPTRNLRGRKSRKSAEPQGSDNEIDPDNDVGGKYSSSTDEPSTEIRPKRYKRWGGGAQSSLPPSSGGNGGCDENEAETPPRKSGGGSSGLVGGGPEILAWGRGGMRSHTRHGSQNSSAGKNAKNNQIAKMIDHLQKLPQNDDKLDLQLKLVSLDEQNIPNLQNLYVFCSPATSTAYFCQYLALENGLQADELELFLVNPSSAIVINPLTDELRPLDEHHSLSDLTKISSHNNLTIAYRKKEVQ